jgi:hypothetical protein
MKDLIKNLMKRIYGLTRKMVCSHLYKYDNTQFLRNETVRDIHNYSASYFKVLVKEYHCIRCDKKKFREDWIQEDKLQAESA